MSDYIEREAALAICENEYKECVKMADWCGNTVAWNIAADVSAIPAADVAPVRHGHWNDINPAVLKPGVNWVCRCSECGCPQDYKHNYCPNCGVRMTVKEANT